MWRHNAIARTRRSAHLVLVAFVVVAAFAHMTAYANSYPGPGGAADDATEWGCWPAGGGIPQSLFDAWWTNVPALTDESVAWDDSCPGWVDARFAIFEDPTFPNALGVTTCVDTIVGKCDTFDVWLDPDRDAEGYCKQFNTWCHEAGHSLGLDHYGTVVDGTCMGSGADACVGSPRTWRYDDHEIGHINTL